MPVKHEHLQVDVLRWRESILKITMNFTFEEPRSCYVMKF